MRVFFFIFDSIDSAFCYASYSRYVILIAARIPFNTIAYFRGTHDYT